MRHETALAERLSATSRTGLVGIRPTDLIALDHYEAQAGERFADTRAAYRHFRRFGQAAGLDPSPFFYLEWYLWQNSDAADFVTCLDHFLSVSRHRPIDPAPFIDSVSFLAEHPQYPTMAHVLAALLQGREHAISPDLQVHLDRLKANQARVHGAIRSGVIRDAPSGRRRLVWVQAGPRFDTTSWYRADQPRSWDLMCNWYVLQGMDLRHGEIHLRQSGTKATAIHHVLQTAPELLSRYDQVLFLDDDLEIAHSDIDRLFHTAEVEGLDAFQPALLPGSHCVWPGLFRRSDKGVRRTTGVEIMMPGFSRRALLDCAPIFGRSVSGFGLDFAVSEHLRRRGMVCGVVDAVGVGHHTSIDEVGGAYYRFMRALGINQKLELYAVMNETGTVPEFRDLSLDEIYSANLVFNSQ
ncbi:MAG: hypothetical protein ACNA7O_18940 [Rhodobacterales bacterium]